MCVIMHRNGLHIWFCINPCFVVLPPIQGQKTDGRDRPLKDALVVQALESWASAEAARILVGVFLVAAAVTAIALVPALTLDSRARTGRAARTGEAGGADPRAEDADAAYAL